MKVLGLDIGSSSVGSAWVDTEAEEVCLGVGVFPAGVEERDTGRGAPKNHARREKRSQRRGLARRSERKRLLRSTLQEWGWMPRDRADIDVWMQVNPWHLRRAGLERELSPAEFGRTLLHMIQRRGASWFDEDSPDEDRMDEKKADPKKQPMKAANEALADQLAGKTFGQFMADLMDERAAEFQPIRNRNDIEGNPRYEFFPDRQMLRDEFEKLWDAQKALAGELSAQLTDDRKRRLSSPAGEGVWKTKGLLWGQRKTYWDAGTLGRCDLEPTDRVCPRCDMHAQEFLVLQDVSVIRLTPEGEHPRRLTDEERRKVIAALEGQKTATAKTVRTALGLNRKGVKEFVTINIEQDATKKLNTNWFARGIVAAIGPNAWISMSPEDRETVNRAVCKFDPREAADVSKLSLGCRKWWGLSDEQTNAFIAAWKTKPRSENRINLSRKAVLNLLPHLRQGFSVTEARQLFAEDGGHDAPMEQRERYALGRPRANHATRHFLAKHPDQLPLAPKLANPVVRKAIHEVRRHVAEYMRKFGCKPDRVVVELAREARLSAKAANRIVADNRRRRDERNAIAGDEELKGVFQDATQRDAARAVERVLLCRAQKGICAYSSLDGNEGRHVTERQAAEGTGLEVDHVIPRSRGGGNGRANKVLCYAATNRGKANQTPKEWLGEDMFAEFARRFRHWKDSPNKEDRKRWDNIHKDVFGMDEYVQSQLVDTAYASRQVTEWLEQALYGETATDGAKRHVFSTNGRYTSLLRRHWGLFYNRDGSPPEGKSRSDHIHHALDAVVIACSGPERVQQIAAAWARVDQQRSEGVYAGDFSIAPPWGTPDAFRAQVIDLARRQIVSHRPERRKIAGPFHKETMYGPILDADGKLTSEFTSRIAVSKLTPNHLRVPAHWDTLADKLRQAETKAERNEIRRQMLSLEDEKPGKSGIVRDRWHRHEIRQALCAAGLDPDQFKDRQLKDALRAAGLVVSGRPVKKVTLRKVFNYVAVAPRRGPDFATGETVVDPNPQSARVYEAQSNHHVEIRRNPKGKWVGKVVTTYDAARRLHPPRSSGLDSRPAVDRNDDATGRFIMSLSVGEMVHMSHPGTGEEGYFSVFKIDNASTPVVHFTPHWDGGKSKEDETFRQREDIHRSPAQLQACEVDGNPPRKVFINPLGAVQVLVGD
jgi:CRISPR-associated endonuclease Csn1